MEYRTLLVHVDSTSEGRQRLDLAVVLAARLGARLIGVGAQASPDIDPRIASVYHILRKMVDEELSKAEKLFRDATRHLPDASWRQTVLPPALAMAEAACGADLLIGSRAAQIPDPGWFARADDLVLSTGTPILLHPPGTREFEARRILIGWKNTREARHAIWASLPFLVAAEKVLLVRFSASGEEDKSLEDVAERLRRHGVKVSLEYRPRVGASVAMGLIQIAEQVQADMIVAGGYGHSRLRELALGGVTRGLLALSPVHLLLCH